MSQQPINIGAYANDGTGDGLRTSFRKTNENFSELYNRPARTVTSATSSTSSADYYIGVNFSGTVAITLHVPSQNGQCLVVKDESGACSQHPITVSGTIDNSTSFVLAINNGSVSLIYNNGWRII